MSASIRLASSVYLWAAILFVIAFAPACSGDDTSGPTVDVGVEADTANPCPSTMLTCGESCIDSNVDHRHCGGCDNACEAGEFCAQGQCQRQCPPGQTLCGEGCFDLDASPLHCGSCNYSCTSGEVCAAGECAPNCGDELRECDGSCRDIAVDPNHCGDCQSPCSLGWVCAAGACQSSCTEDLTDCDGSCRHVDSDPAHCGSCFSACLPNEACIGGTCHGIDDFPQTLPDLHLWLRADRGVSLDGDRINSWKNSAGDDVAVPSTGLSAPSFKGQVSGGHGAAHFNGVDQGLSMTDLSFPNGPFVHTVVFIPEQTLDENTSTAMPLFATNLSPVSSQLAVMINNHGEGRAQLYLSIDGDIVASAESSPQRWLAGHPYIVSFVYDGQAITTHINGESDSVSAFNGSLQWLQGAHLGSTESGDDSGGYLLEALLFSASLPSADLDALHAHLLSRYRLFSPDASWIDAYSAEEQAFIIDHQMPESMVESGDFRFLPPQVSCKEHRSQPSPFDGLYAITLGADEAFTVYCNMTHDGGGWTQIAHVHQDPDTPFPGREDSGDDPHQLFYSVDVDGLAFQEIGITHNGLSQGNFASFHLADAQVWDSSSSEQIFLQDNDHYSILGLSAPTDQGTDLALACLNSSTESCLEVSRSIAHGAVSSGTGSCRSLRRALAETCGGWGQPPSVGDSSWTIHGGRIFLR